MLGLDDSSKHSSPTSEPSRRWAVGIIPARYGSTRFEGKPLAELMGKPLVQWVYEQASLAKRLDGVVVATDDERIRGRVENFGGYAVMTSPHHRSGTDRVAEVAQSLEAEVIVNIQGDEPLIEPGLIDAIVEPFVNDPELKMTTAATDFLPTESPDDPNIVKVVCDKQRYALYFSRSLIPFAQQETGLSPQKHIGIYAYRRDFLLQFASWEPAPLEQAESLEQLRALENGERIKVIPTSYSSIGIDTPEDLAALRKMLEEKRE